MRSCIHPDGSPGSYQPRRFSANVENVTTVTARGAGFGYNVAISKPKGHRVMFFSGSPKHKMLLAIVGPSISCGIFFMLAINYFREKNAFSCALMILMSVTVLYIAIEGYKKVLKALP